MDFHRWLHVETRTHNTTGFWGPPDSNHQFCEPHYTVTPFLAEFYNSWSSFIFVGTALYGLQHPQLRQDPFILGAFVWLIAIGLGSFAFHGTMQHHMQLADEIPMVGFMATLLLAKIGHPGLGHPWVPTDRAATLWVCLTLMICATLVWIYVILNLYEIFVHGFTMVVVLHTAIVCKFPKSPHAHKQVVMDWCSNGSLGAILLGRVVWEIENRCCQEYPFIWPLHTVWHGLSCLSAYFSIILTWYLRSSENSTESLVSFWGMPTIMTTSTTRDPKKVD